MKGAELESLINPDNDGVKIFKDFCRKLDRINNNAVVLNE